MPLNRAAMIPYLTLMTFAVTHVSRSFACILLLNGWEPVSVGDRAMAADVVFFGEAARTFKLQKDPKDSKTYTALFNVRQVFKGQEVVDKVITGSSHRTGQKDLNNKNFSKPDYHNYYNVSNFGERSMCYADVEEQMTYIIFATEFNGGLSAKYDDLFGAAEEYTEEKEEEIWNALGWPSWSEWGPCNAFCDGGVQIRSRDYPKPVDPQCTGKEQEQRKCNSFSCKGTTDLLSLIKSHNVLPPGVTKDKSRPGAYLITPEIGIHAPLRNYFPRQFPEEFSIMATIKPQEVDDNDNGGFLFTVSDLLGFVLLGVQVGLGRSNLVYNANYLDPKDSVYELDLKLAVAEWNRIALSIFTNGSLFSYVNCRLRDSIQLKHGDGDSAKRNQRIGQDTVISIGGTFHQNSNFPSFQGSIDQLLISDDPLAGRLQCEDDTESLSGKPSPDDVIHTDPWQPSDDVTGQLGPTLSAETTVELSWSEWSACSVTCGQGTKTRTASCPEKSEDKCYELVKGAVQKGDCHEVRCKAARCKRRCHNRGRCAGNNKCSCLPGYFGRSCQKVRCYPRCENGGRCVEPDRCSCTEGWGGKYCHKAKCQPPCANGGRCVQPGICSCRHGYLPPDCRAYCSSPCYNGGSCIGFNVCKCPPGYTGQLCQTAVCPSGCGAGGQCVTPNQCVCAAGWGGDTCQTPVCDPGCDNGGTCVLPYFCICPPGTYGTLCEHYMCNPSCLNGGTCVGPYQCRCDAGYSGSFCQDAICPSLCHNGGTCVSGGMCQCTHGYYGDRCQHRICESQAHRMPTYKRHSVPFYYVENYPCGTWKNDVCSATRLSYRTVYHLEYTTVYRCT